MIRLNLFKQGILIKKYIKDIFPLVDLELQNWYRMANQIPDKTLNELARKSIEHKSFHCKGGAIYALFPEVKEKEFVGFVIALQTISDYLDNLCDRAGVYDEKAFRQLHLAIIDALETEENEEGNYYQYYPFKDDGGYLVALKNYCRTFIQNNLPSYFLVKDEILELISLYVDLQSLKHLAVSIREEKLLVWAEKRKPSEISPWEFAAATGSTLGIFMLAAAATNQDLTKAQVQEINNSYFPWIAGLHILLDYFIDLEEDEREGDLNFVSYYQDFKRCRERLALFLTKSQVKANKLSNPVFHLTVLEGLLAMYLSDPKAFYGDKKEVAFELLKMGGFRVNLLHRICLLLRERGKL